MQPSSTAAVLGVLLSAAAVVAATTVNYNGINLSDIGPFLAACRANRQNCTDYSCLARASYWSDLRHLELLSCHSLADCHHMDTGFVCSRSGSSKRGFCECPRGAAFNATSCQCQKAELCPRESPKPALIGNRGGPSCHNGMHCRDSDCSCSDLTTTLYEASGRFCVLPWDSATSPLTAQDPGSAHHALVVVMVILGIGIGIALLAICVYIATDSVTCDRGDYECEASEHEVVDKESGWVTKVAKKRVIGDSGSRSDRRSQKGESDGNSNMTKHVAAWDLPSLDYLSEEQTLKYLRKHEEDVHRREESQQLNNNQNNNNNSAASTSNSSSPSPGASSLPESERAPMTAAAGHNRGFQSSEEPKDV